MSVGVTRTHYINLYSGTSDDGQSIKNL